MFDRQMMKLKISAFLLVLLLITGCSKSVDIPEDKYALLLSFGKIEKVIEGPGKIDAAPIIEHVVYIEKKNDISIGNGKYTIHYIVRDPKIYYLTFHNSNSRFQQLVEAEITNRALNGETINSKAIVIRIIDEMNLPIEIDRKK